MIIPYWIARAKGAGLLGVDVHKLNKPNIPELGGLCVISGFLLGLFSYIIILVFLNKETSNLIPLFAMIISVFIATIIGLVDDILGWKIGLRIRYKIILTFFISVPIMIINSTAAIVNIPFIGQIFVGVLYPLIIIPVGIMGASNSFNMMAGYNGLEASAGVIILSSLGYMAYHSNVGYVAVIAFCMVAALTAFLIYNWYPAKLFPGDILTYSVGSLIAIISILANLEKFALIMFIPYGLEFFLKLRGKMNKESFAKVNEDGSLSRPYRKYYGLEHIAIDLVIEIKKKICKDKKVYEKEVVICLLLFQVICCLGSLVLFLK